MVTDIFAVARMRAYDERNKLGIGAYESVDIFKILRDRENVSLIIGELKGDMSGFFMRKDDVELIFINSARSLGHQYFAAAHEYYHLRYDKGLSGKVCLIDKFDDEYDNEREANVFASYFLIPDDALRYHVDSRTSGEKISIRDILYLENYFRVSHSLMLLRLKDMKLITEEEAKDLAPQIISRAKKLGFSTELYKNGKGKEEVVYSEYPVLAAELLETGKITYGKYEELLLDGKYADILFGGEEEIQNDNPDPNSLR